MFSSNSHEFQRRLARIPQGVLTLLPSPRACNSALTGRGAIDLPGAPRSTHARARNPKFHRPRGSGNGFRNGLQQALHVLQLRPSFIQPVSSQRRHTGDPRGGAAVLITATCLLVSSSSRFPIAVVSSMIDPFIFSSSVMLFVKWARSHLFASGLSDSTRLESRVGIALAAALLVPITGQYAVRETMPRAPVSVA